MVRASLNALDILLVVKPGTLSTTKLEQDRTERWGGTGGQCYSEQAPATAGDFTLVPWSKALQERINHLPPLPAKEQKRRREEAEEMVRQMDEAGERLRLWVEEYLDKPRLLKPTAIQEFVVEAERQWDAIRVYDDPVAIKVLKMYVFEERLEDRAGPRLREAESARRGVPGGQDRRFSGCTGNSLMRQEREWTGVLKPLSWRTEMPERPRRNAKASRRGVVQ